MGTEWKRAELRELVEISTEKIATSDISKRSYVSTDNMAPDFGGVTFNTSTPSVSKTSRFWKDDVLFSNIRTYFRKLWIADRDGGCSNDVIVFRAKKGIHPRFIFYSLMDERFIEHTVQTSKGTKMPRGDKSAIVQYNTAVPPLPEQKAIAHILGTLDDKIELNRRMNATLEGMAQALFKSWFVDFDPVIDNALTAGNPIPDELAARAEVRRQALANGTANREAAKHFPTAFQQTESMGWIPEGWEETKLQGVGKIVTGKTPPKALDDAYGNQAMFLTPTDYNGDLITIDTQRRLSCIGETSIKNSRLENGSICVTCIGSQMGKTTLVLEPTYSNQQINSITPNKDIYRNFLLFNLRQRRDEIFSIGASGSTMPIVNKGTFSQLPVLLPSDPALSQFDRIAGQLIKRISSNLKLTQYLTKLRDTLLPKLISGELSIKL